MAEPVLAIQESSIPPSVLLVDAIVVDRKGNVVRDMKASDFTVTFESGAQRVASLVPMFRGPGATEAARSLPKNTVGDARIEPNRAVLFVVDQQSLLRGDEARANAIVETCLGLLGSNDQLGLMVLPGPSGAIPMRREAIRAALKNVKALRAPDGMAAQDLRAPESPERLEDWLSPGRLAGEEAVSAEAARAHALATLDGLLKLLEELRRVGGPKTLLLLSAGVSNADLADEFERVATQAAVADTRIYTLQVPTPARKFAEIGRPGLDAIARLTGGSLVALGGKAGETLQRTLGELSLSYLLVLERPPYPVTWPQAMAVRTRRSDTVVRTAAWAVAGRPLPALAASASAPRPPPSVQPAVEKPGAEARTPRGDPAVDALIARAGDYVRSYWNDVSAVVAEEVYEQRVVNAMTGTPQGTRKLVSDFLLVKVPGDVGWLPFRDVFEVDGTQVRERQNRLQKLFVEAPADKAIQNANAILEESARYNIGAVRRTLNVPTLPLMFIHPDNAARFEFKKSGEENAGGMRTWVVEYRETVRPTIIRTSKDTNVAASGRFWIEPTSGRIVKTALEAGGASIVVNYRPSKEAQGVWFPATMDERYGRSIVAKASYSKIRRFQVFTEEKLKDPK